MSYKYLPYVANLQRVASLEAELEALQGRERDIQRELTYRLGEFIRDGRRRHARLSGTACLCCGEACDCCTCMQLWLAEKQAPQAT